MTTPKDKFKEAVFLSFEKEIIKKIVFSRPINTETAKVVARLCAHRGRKFLAFEYFLPGDTVSHKNLSREDIGSEIEHLFAVYKQANLITTVKDVEWKTSIKGKEITLGADALIQKLSCERPSFEIAIESLENKKNYILEGGEDFLITLGISDKNGRVHDKKQGKFRQLNKFLEHIEACYDNLPKTDPITIYDLCCGKSYLTFAVYHYFTVVKKRCVYMLGIDLKRDVISWCEQTANALGYSGMHFICDDILNAPKDISPDMVISLHACDVATDIVINTAAALSAKIILSTPCCHRYMNGKIKSEELSFITEFPHLANKLCEVTTDAIRLLRLSSLGYNVSALELTDPDDTPKNTLLKAIKNEKISQIELEKRKEKYHRALDFILRDGKTNYLEEFCK